jgi:hypothetical protein
MRLGKARGITCCETPKIILEGSSPSQGLSCKNCDAYVDLVAYKRPPDRATMSHKYKRLLTQGRHRT